MCSSCAGKLPGTGTVSMIGLLARTSYLAVIIVRYWCGRSTVPPTVPVPPYTRPLVPFAPCVFALLATRNGVVVVGSNQQTLVPHLIQEEALPKLGK